MLTKTLRAALAAALGSAALVTGVQADNDRRGDWDDATRGCASNTSPDNARLNSLQVVGLVNDPTSMWQRLTCFNERRPGEAMDIGVVSGLMADTRLVGIDFRVQDGKLYGVGNDGSLYQIDTTTAVATKVGALTIALSGTRFGVDFNPAANALRIVSDTGQNLRQPGGNLGTATPLPVTVADTALNTGGPAPVGVTGITGAAYTNNDNQVPATGTTLFDLSSGADNVQIQSPANSGIVVATGALGVDAAAATGFDISSKLRKGVTVDNKGYASLSVGGTTGFYKIDLLTGAAEAKGAFAQRDQGLIDIAIPLNQL